MCGREWAACLTALGKARIVYSWDASIDFNYELTLFWFCVQDCHFMGRVMHEVESYSQGQLVMEVMFPLIV